MLRIPGTPIIIDGAGENSPYEPAPRAGAVYVNHSAAPNAHLEVWPVPRAGKHEVRWLA